jgi:hypothetical protein
MVVKTSAPPAGLTAQVRPTAWISDGASGSARDGEAGIATSAPMADRTNPMQVTARRTVWLTRLD